MQAARKWGERNQIGQQARRHMHCRLRHQRAMYRVVTSPTMRVSPSLEWDYQILRGAKISILDGKLHLQWGCPEGYPPSQLTEHHFWSALHWGLIRLKDTPQEMTGGHSHYSGAGRLTPQGVSAILPEHLEVFVRWVEGALANATIATGYVLRLAYQNLMEPVAIREQAAAHLTDAAFILAVLRLLIRPHREVTQRLSPPFERGTEDEWTVRPPPLERRPQLQPNAPSFLA